MEHWKTDYKEMEESLLSQRYKDKWKPLLQDQEIWDNALKQVYRLYGEEDQIVPWPERKERKERMKGRKVEYKKKVKGKSNPTPKQKSLSPREGTNLFNQTKFNPGLFTTGSSNEGYSFFVSNQVENQRKGAKYNLKWIINLYCANCATLIITSHMHKIKASEFVLNKHVINCLQDNKLIIEVHAKFTTNKKGFIRLDKAKKLSSTPKRKLKRIKQAFRKAKINAEIVWKGYQMERFPAVLSHKWTIY